MSERTASSWIGSIEAEGPARRDIEKRYPQLDVLGSAQVHCKVHMSLAAVDERLSGGEVACTHPVSSE